MADSLSGGDCRIGDLVTIVVTLLGPAVPCPFKVSTGALVVLNHTLAAIVLGISSQTGEEHIEVDTLEVESQSDTVVDARDACRVTDRRQVLVIDNAVTVDILIEKITDSRNTESIIAVIIYFLMRCEITISRGVPVNQVTPILSETEAFFAILIGIFL